VGSDRLKDAEFLTFVEQVNTNTRAALISRPFHVLQPHCRCLNVAKCLVANVIHHRLQYKVASRVAVMGDDRFRSRTASRLLSRSL
jgi:hypothetical protein